MCPDGGQRADALVNRQAVIEAAIELLPAHPEASMQEIADFSGVGRTTIYRHFPNRDALLEAVTEFAMAESRRLIGEILDRGMPVDQTLRIVCRKNMEIGMRFRVLHAFRDVTSPLIRAMTRAADSPVPRYLVEAQRRGEVRDDLPPSWLRATFVSLTTSMIGDVVAKRLDPSEAGDVLGETIVSAMVVS
jgi:AcrR family transcriptional regulator